MYSRKLHLQHRLSFSGAKYEPVLVDNAYKVHMKLMIKSVSASDYGSYKCVSKNSLGETDGTIKLYRKYIFHKNTIDRKYTVQAVIDKAFR